MSTWNPTEEVLLANYLASRVCGRAAGTTNDECVQNHPRDSYFVGNLRPLPGEDADDGNGAGYLRELLTKLAPVAFGAEFRVLTTAEGFQVTTTLSWECYYRVFPTFQQQLQQRAAGSDDRTRDNSYSPAAARIRASSPGTDTETDSSEEQAESTTSPEVTESASDRRIRRRPNDSLFIRFRKIRCTAAAPITIVRSGDSWTADTSALLQAISTEFARARQTMLDDGERLRVDASPDQQVRVPDSALSSEAAFSDFLRSLRTEVLPGWNVTVLVTVRDAEDQDPAPVILFEITNSSRDDGRAPNTEGYLFACSAHFQFDDAEVLPFDIDLAPKGFRYDRRMWGRGFNCAVEMVNDDTRRFRTTFTPRYSQMRLGTRSVPQARFADLASDPLPVLAEIRLAMDEYKQVWNDVRASNAAADRNWIATFGTEYQADETRFQSEIDRFVTGVDILRADADAKLAFQLMNETFWRLGDRPDPAKRKESWRLFQLVFIVTQLSGITGLREAAGNRAVSDDRETVDIIYFPTGGGKTEAYLGTLVFHCFYDRLRGKSAGVTAWTRFPLRLLTLQQTQRFADVIGTAELIRRTHADARLSGRSVDGFSVGYLVGAEATPNELLNPSVYRYAKDKDQINWSQANDPAARQEWRRLLRCPACQTATVTVDFDVRIVRLLHRCTNSRCAFTNGIIPIYVVDNEIFRYLPTAIVGTIDKLAGIGNQRKLSQLFGVVDGRCSVHGFYKGKCCQKDCADPRMLRAGVPAGLSGPTLFIQDELHLLKEGLGTFDSHYESFVQQLRRRFGQQDTLKIIASSATIEAFERQVLHLYGRRSARVFPGLGPQLGQSFYADTRDFEQRVYIGLIPHNKTIFNSILEVIELYHSEVCALTNLSLGDSNPFGGELRPGTDEWRALMDYYTTSLTYFLNGNELTSIHTDLEGDTSPRLAASGYAPLNVMELTSNVPTEGVTTILDRLERNGVDSRTQDAVLATAMVSHGVDIDRLNAMIFYGMPRQNAEYIQASSRVGRSHLGLIFNVLHPARERDRSHYSYFVKFHEFLGQLVEPVAINRWARYSVQRTLPGLFMGVLLQVLANGPSGGNPDRMYMLDYVKQQISGGSISEADFMSFLEDAYLTADASDSRDCRAWEVESLAR